MIHAEFDSDHIFAMETKSLCKQSSAQIYLPIKNLDWLHKMKPLVVYPVFLHFNQAYGLLANLLTSTTYSPNKPKSMPQQTKQLYLPLQIMLSVSTAYIIRQLATLPCWRRKGMVTLTQIGMGQVSAMSHSMSDIWIYSVAFLGQSKHYHTFPCFPGPVFLGQFHGNRTLNWVHNHLFYFKLQQLPGL